MSKLFLVMAVISMTIFSSVAQSDPLCETGTLTYIEGEINNNAVDFSHSSGLPETSGVAEFKLFPEGEPSTKLVCALQGDPNDPQVTGLPHAFDHRIVCAGHDELSFNTHFIGADALDPKLEQKLCQGTTFSYFQESSVPDIDEPSKGIFRNVYDGELFVNGCVNFGDDDVPDVQINMVVDGYLCIEY